MKQKNIGRMELARALGIGRATLWRYEKNGLVPPPARLSGNRVAYSPMAIQVAAAVVGALV